MDSSEADADAYSSSPTFSLTRTDDTVHPTPFPSSAKKDLALFFFAVLALLACLLVVVVFRSCLRWRTRHWPQWTAWRQLLWPQQQAQQAQQWPGMLTALEFFSRRDGAVNLYACKTSGSMPPKVRHQLAELKVQGILRGKTDSVSLPKRTDAHSALEALPTELYLNIFQNLDLGSALALGRTSRFFARKVRPADWISDDDKLDYVLFAEGFRRHKWRGRLACPGCLVVKKWSEFGKDMRSGKCGRGGEGELERRCRVCCGGGEDGRKGEMV